jgi:DNA replication and repair protein RecF
LHIRRLQLANFRNYRELDLALPSGRLVFLGDNAQGKSNILEAVYLLAAARSIRATLDAEMIGWPAETETPPIARTVAWVERRAVPVQLEVVVSAAGQGEAIRGSKRLRVNGIPRRAIDFIGQLRAVLFTADDLEIVSGGPGGRRRFLDLLLSQIDRQYYAAVQRYGRVLQQRNAVLRRIREGNARTDELVFWDESLAHEAAIILAGRLKACVRLSPLAAAAHQELSGEAREGLSVIYRPKLGDQWEALVSEQTGPAEESLRGVISAAVLAGRRRDLAAGVSLVGPHRDDLEITLNRAAAAAYGSRAQIRTATLALRLAEARLLREVSDDTPVVLLDDIVSELDDRRRRSVLAGIADFDQVWLTATDAGAFPPDFLAGAAVFRVSGGRASAA